MFLILLITTGFKKPGKHLPRKKLLFPEPFLPTKISQDNIKFNIYELLLIEIYEWLQIKSLMMIFMILEDKMLLMGSKRKVSLHEKYNERKMFDLTYYIVSWTEWVNDDLISVASKSLDYNLEKSLVIVSSKKAQLIDQIQ